MEFKMKPIIVDANQWDGTYKGMKELEVLYPTLQTMASSYHEERNTVSNWRVKGRTDTFTMYKDHWLILQDGYFRQLSADKFVESFVPCAVGDLV